MDRQIVQFSALPLDTDMLNTNRYAMVGLGVLAQALLGSGTYVDGLACTPVGGNMQVQIGPGSIYTTTSVDATAYGSLSADTTDQIVQQGLTWGQTPFTLTAPSTGGFSQIYLIEAQFQQVDATPVALLYYNSANPPTPLTGQATNTIRKSVCALQLKAGTAAASPTAPTADAGWTGLYTITVAQGQTVIIAGNISTLASAPFIPSKVGQAFKVYAGNPNGNVAGTQGTAPSRFPDVIWDTVNSLLWVCTTTGNAAGAVWTQVGSNGATFPFWCGTSTGSANAQSVTPPSAMQSLQTGVGVAFKAGFTNSGATTLTVGSFGTIAIRKDGPTGPIALTGGEIVVGNIVSARYDGTFWQLTATEMGTAALANASSATGTVAAVTGSIAANHVAIFADSLGTVKDGGAYNVPGGNYVNATATVSAGLYNVDTSGGAFSLNLAAFPNVGDAYTFVDPVNSWTMNNLTISGNGHNIGTTSSGAASTFLADVGDFEFSLIWTGVFWRLF